MAGQTRRGRREILMGPPKTRGSNPNGAFDGSGQRRGLPCRADRQRPAAAAVAWLARILADLGACHGATRRSLHGVRARPARVRRQRQTHRAVRSRPACRGHVGADGPLGVRQIGVIGHDVGGALMQPMARTAPQRVAGLFFFDFVYPGIGPRMAEPDRLNNIWYQSFHQLEMAPALVGATRETFTDNFLKPGNLAGGFAHYRASHEGRIRMMKGEAPQLAPIDVPACIRWAEHDPLFPYAWTDRLGETFSDLDLARFPAVGHFPHREDPDRAAAEIAAFFTRIGYS